MANGRIPIRDSPLPTRHSPASASAEMRALGLDIDRIKRLAGGHEQPIALLAAEADIGAGLGQADLADPCAVRCEHLAAVIPSAAPAGPDPYIVVDIDPQAIREAGFAVERHVDELARVR